MILAGLVVFFALWVSSLHLTLPWRLGRIGLIVVPILAVFQGSVRMFAPQRMAAWWERRSIEQRVAIYWTHHLAIGVVFAAGLAFLLRGGFFGSAGEDHLQKFLQWLWIDSILLVSCLADLSGTTRNVWRPTRP